MHINGTTLPAHVQCKSTMGSTHDHLDDATIGDSNQNEAGYLWELA